MTQVSTTNLLHPRQVSELTDSNKRLRAMLNSGPHVTDQLQDGGAHVSKQIKDNEKLLEQAPALIPKDEIDEAVKLEKKLRAEWLKGMPTQAEMRKNPPGAVDKNMAWQKTTKKKQLQWKHLRRRLHASGISEHKLSDEGDISNVEIYRPKGGSGEMSMDNAQIPGKNFFLPNKVTMAAVMDDEEEAFLKENAPDVLEKMPLWNNEMRHKVLDKVREIMAERIVSNLVSTQVARKPGRPAKAAAAA